MQPNNFLLNQAKTLSLLTVQLNDEYEHLREENIKLKEELKHANEAKHSLSCLLYTSPSPRDS